ncbi:MAG: UbiA family prenyltransferase [Myxococcota bacterium]|jgi:4-hydroxybenzoate polyprenyltransferase|nr:UbiA family prenyltransferase [Myxococcota bacterium]
MKLISSIISSLESEDVPLSACLLTFFSAVMVRTGVEMFSDSDALVQLSLLRFLHYTLFYLSLLGGLSLILSALGRVPLVRVIKVVGPAFLVLLVAPITDLIATGGQGMNMSYLRPGIHDDLWMQYLTFFHVYREGGASHGIRLELAIVIVSTAVYLRHKGAAAWRCALGAIAVYTFVFLNGMLLFWMQWTYQLFNVRPIYDDRMAIYFLSTWLFFVAAALALLCNRTYFLAMWKDLRWMRLGHYLLMYLLGVAFAVCEGKLALEPVRLFELVLLPMALIPAVLFTIVTNNIVDLPIDQISSPNRPLFKPGIDHRTYAQTQGAFLAAAIYYAALAGPLGCMAILAFTGAYYLYSMPPVRFKRVPVLSKLTIAVCTLAMLSAGYGIAGGNFTELPSSLIAFFLVPFTLAVNFIDLKDYDGDKAAGIRTLPVLIGMRPAQLIIAALFVALYGLATFAVDLATLAGLPRLANLPLLLGLGLAQGFSLTRTPYKELPVFTLYLLSIAGLVAYVFLLAPKEILTQLP